MKQKYLKCDKCGTLIEVFRDCTCDDCGIICCGERMVELVPGTSDGAREKHVPVYVKEGNIINVTVGDIEHPMTSEHYIEWIELKTKYGKQRKTLKPESDPKATFVLVEGDELESVYAYCNLHGLWKA